MQHEVQVTAKGWNVYRNVLQNTMNSIWDMSVALSL